VFQFIGGIFGVASAALLLGNSLGDEHVLYAVTVAGKYGTAAAFGAETLMAALLMGVVLWSSIDPP
jgi:glycerol uptake facilitator-like aquaporin